MQYAKRKTLLMQLTHIQLMYIFKYRYVLSWLRCMVKLQEQISVSIMCIASDGGKKKKWDEYTTYERNVEIIV